MGRRAAWLTTCAALAGLACAGQDGLAPRPTAVEPGSGYAGADTRVVIRGDGFAVRAQQPAAGGAPEVDARYRAWLGGAELQAVTWVDVHTLHATVPAGLPAGTHALEVEGPFARRGRLEEAFTVADSAAGALQVAVASARSTVSVGQEFPVTATVVNSGSAEVTGVAPESLPIQPAGGAVVSIVGGPSPPSVAAILPGEGAAFAWTLSPAAAGALDLGAVVTGTDSFSGELVRGTAPLRAQVLVERPPALAAELVAPRSAALGTHFGVTMVVANAGEAGARAVAPTPLALAPGSVAATLASGPVPAEADVDGGGAATFSWTWFAGDVEGPIRFTGGAAGVDENSGSQVTAPPATSGEVAVGRAALRAVLAASPPSVRVGEAITVTLTLTNPGSAPVESVVPDPPLATGTGGVAPSVVGPAPGSIPTLAPGASGTFTWTFTAAAPGQLSFSAGATGFDGLSGAPLGASASVLNAVTVAAPPALAVTAFTASPATVVPGQPVAVALTLANGTGSTVDVTAVVPTVVPAVDAACTAPAPSAPLALAPAAAVTVAWSCTFGAPGSYVVGASVAATEAGTGTSVGPRVDGAPVTVRAMTLSVSSFAASQGVVSTGQAFAVTLLLRNAAAAPAEVQAVTPAAAPSLGIGCTAVAPVPPQPIAAGATLAFSWSCSAGAAGAFALSATVSARDAAGAEATLSAGPLTVTAQVAASVSVDAFAAAPSTVGANEPSTVTLTLRNVGGAAASVTSVSPSIVPAGKASCTAPLPGPPQVLTGGASLALRWTCAASTTRSYNLGVTLRAVDVNSGASVAPAVATLPLTVQ